MSATVSRRSFLSLLSLAAMTLVWPKSAYGFDQSGHNKVTEVILFGQSKWKGKGLEIIKALESAATLCLDQDQGNCQKDLDRLIKQGVPGLPRLEEINLGKEHIKLASGSYGNHQAFTHLGWHYSYKDEDTSGHHVPGPVKEVVKAGFGDDWPRRWVLRKRLLVDSVANLLDFSLFDRMRVFIGWGDGGLCDAFAQLLYYVHVLGDYLSTIENNIDAEDYEFEPLTIPFAVQAASESNRDFFWDVEEALKVLFDNENTREDYEQLISDLNDRANRVRERPSVGSSAAAKRYKRHIERTIESLERYIPGMLAKTPFFSKVFY